MSTWPDIPYVPLWGDLPPETDALPRFKDRLQASLFFGQEGSMQSKKLDNPTDWRSSGFRWLTWASVTALSSAREAIPKDSEKQARSKWIDSAELNQVKGDPLLAVLHELRNYAVHFDPISSTLKSFRAFVGSETGEREIDFGPSAFFVPVDWNELSVLRNIAEARNPSVTKDMVDWFNEQSKQWPAINIIGVGRKRLAEYVAPFVQREIL